MIVLFVVFFKTNLIDPLLDCWPVKNKTKQKKNQVELFN